MQQYPFIFSDEPKYRIRRHVFFWLFWWIFQGFLYSFVAITRGSHYPIRLYMSLLESLVFMAAHMFLAYSLMYFVIPRFLLKQQYWLTGTWTFALFIITGFMATAIGHYIVDPMREALVGENYFGPVRTYDVSIHLSLLAGLRGGITVAGIAAAIKLMKYWYLKEQRNLQLQKENIASQLQLLKAQVHPHFLFNTLNNIYSYTQNTSPVASKLVSGLSDMLRFILYECNQPTVTLSKELRMIGDYISLEKVRYGNMLDLHIDLPKQTNDCSIAPLLLLPLVENCFKHGTSHVLEQPWISLHVSLHDNQMHMKLLNGKDGRRDDEQRPHGIGIKNVQKRLALLYPGKHELTITNEEDVFIVNLKIELERQKDATARTTQSPVLTDA